MRKEPKPDITPPKKVVPWLFWYKCVTCRKLVKHEPVWRYRWWTVCCKCAESSKIAIEKIEYFIEHDLVITDNR